MSRYLSHFEWVTGSLERVTIFRKKCSTVSKMESKVVATYTCKKIQFSFLTSQKNWISDDIHTFSFHTFHCKFNLELVCTSFINLHFAISSKIQHCATRSELVGPRAQGWQRVNKEGGGYHAIIILARKKPGLPTHPTFENFPYFEGKYLSLFQNIFVHKLSPNSWQHWKRNRRGAITSSWSSSRPWSTPTASRTLSCLQSYYIFQHLFALTACSFVSPCAITNLRASSFFCCSSAFVGTFLSLLMANMSWTLM